MSNLEELKVINRQALIKEFTEKTKSCAFEWQLLSPGTYQAVSGSYVYNISKTSPTTIILDIIKDNEFYRSYNSSLLEDVNDLYEAVEVYYSDDNSLEKLKEVELFIANMRSCRGSTGSVTGSGIVVIGGTATVTKGTPSNILTSPNFLTFGPTSFPWTGSLSDISNTPKSSPLLDFTYIEQTVTSTSPQQWGYANVGFNASLFSSLVGPYSFNMRVAHARGVGQPGVTMILELLANSSVVYYNSLTVGSSYNLYSTGIQAIPVSVNSLSTLSARISMFTNSGDTQPRRLRVYAVDIRIYGLLPN